MNRYILIRRLRGPAFLLLVGLMALLAEAHILSWGRSWPLYLILAGVLLLAERAALAMVSHDPAAQYPQGVPYGAAQYGAGPYGGVTPAPPPPENPGTAIVPAESHDFGNGGNGGQL